LNWRQQANQATWDNDCGFRSGIILPRVALFHEILRVRKLAFVEVHVPLRGADIRVPE
jgi:hypothetical protein